MLIVGDVHGKIDQFLDLVSEYLINNPTEIVVQLGDLGFRKEWELVDQWLIENNYVNRLLVVAGNHDYYEKWPGFWAFETDDYNIVTQKSSEYFFVRGANSIDKHLRTEGKDWFSNEEMSYGELGYAVDMYLDLKPKYMFSHTCPSSVKKQLFGYNESSRTEQALQIMFENHQPEIHFFGHFHKHVDEVINGTRFICLAELQTYEL